MVDGSNDGDFTVSMTGIAAASAIHWLQTQQLLKDNITVEEKLFIFLPL